MRSAYDIPAFEFGIREHGPETMKTIGLGMMWIDFAANRSSALARLRQRTEVKYALVVDANDVLMLAPGFDAAACKQVLDADVYSLPIRLGLICHQRADDNKPRVWRSSDLSTS